MFSQLDLFETSEPISEETLQREHDKKYKEKKLSPRDWEVYRLIYHNSIVENRRTSQREIYEKVSGFNWNDDITAHDHCPMIWTSIKNNNESLEHEKIIISFNFEYWIGNEQETKVYLDKLWNDLAPRLVRYWKYLGKFKENGQGKLISCQGNPIDDESEARRFVESYAKLG